jgi:hypothetical protein
MQIFKLSFIAEIAIIILLLFLIFQTYPAWIALIVALVVAALVYARITSTVILPLSPFLVKELTTSVDFKDDNGKLVHVTKEQFIKPCKDTAAQYTDKGLAGTGLVKNFESFLEINGKWEKVKSQLAKTIVGSEIEVTTYFDPPLTDKIWTKRKLEFECHDCFIEKEESFVYRIDNPTELFKIIFNFHPNHKPEQIKVYEVIGGNKKIIGTINSTYTDSPAFMWSIKAPHLASEYLFIWTWQESLQLNRS